MINIDELISKARVSSKKTELLVYQAIKSEILLYKSAKNAKSYDEVAELGIIRKMVKQREDSQKQYLAAGREDLVLNEGLELEVLRKFLPEPVNESDIHSFIKNDLEYFSQFSDDFILENGEKTTGYKIPKKEMGNAIKYLKSKFPQADGKLISEIVKKYIV